jgi:hypothetical protein
MSHRVIFGVLDTSAEAQDRAAAAKARNLTLSWARWCYQGEILEDITVDNILCRAAAKQDCEFCFVQSYGHIILEESGPAGSRPQDFVERLNDWLSTHEVFLMGQIIRSEGRGYGLTSRRLLVNVREYKRLGYPLFGATLSACPADSEALSDLEFGLAENERGSGLPGGALIAAGISNNAAIRSFPPVLSRFFADVGSNLSEDGAVLARMRRDSEQARSGIFVLNFESYDDIEEPPSAWRRPASALYSVAAGLKPNRILETHGFDHNTRLVYFDYSSHALAFRRWLVGAWDGGDLPQFLRRNLDRSDFADAHFHIRPDASECDPDFWRMERAWRVELGRWGGERALAEHWRQYRHLDHSYILCDLLRNQEELLAQIRGDLSPVIWWSNAFATTYSGWHYSPEEKREVYEKWITRLNRRAPELLLYGGDHTNGSVNRVTAREYFERYFANDGSPLSQRTLCGKSLRF